MKRVLPSAMPMIILLLAMAAAATPWYGILEAESMTIVRGWTVARGNEGNFPAYPNLWSGNRLRGDAGDAEAVAKGELRVPTAGEYALWVRYESSYGFDARFAVELSQKGKRVLSALCGDRDDVKYFDGEWLVQGPWDYHNTDYVYQHFHVALAAGPVAVTLRTVVNGPRGTVRLVDLLCLTSDLAMEPGPEMMGWREATAIEPARPPILARCVKPAYVRITVPAQATEAVAASILYRGFRPVGGVGPNRVYTVRTGVSPERPWEKPAGAGDYDKLPPGFDSGWRRVDLSALSPAVLQVTASGAVTAAVSHRPDGGRAVACRVEKGVPRQFMVGTGNSRLEDGALRGKPAVLIADMLQADVNDLNAFLVPGKRPYKFGLTSGLSYFMDGYDRRELARALGASGLYFSCPPEFYTVDNAAKWGFNRGVGYIASQNAHLTRACYEGDYRAFDAFLAKTAETLRKDGLADIPQNVKMIEEAGPPSLATLRDWKGIADRFRVYARQQGVKPAELLSRQALQQALNAGLTTDEALWPLVTLGSGTPQEAEGNPVLFYHSKYFGSQVFSDNCAAAVKLVEKYFAPGSVANSGAVWPQDGHGVRTNWYDEFMLFRRRGMTAFGSEMPWGLCGKPHYVGPQSESYEGTLARAVAKYYQAVLGPTHMLACYRYGYPAEYVETASYALASHGFTSLQFFDTGFGNAPDVRHAIKRFAYAMGAVEDWQSESAVVPAKVAMGWSETTAIWDQAERTDTGFNMPGNVMYPLERHYLYLLLRHLQLPVDLLCDADIEEGRLKDYQVYVLVGDHLTAGAAEALCRWVEAGGVLISVAGGGLWDEYNRPLDALKDVYGVKGARQYAKEQGQEYVPGAVYATNPNDNRLVKHQQALRAKLELIHAYPIDAVTLMGNAGAPVPVFGYRQGFKTEGGTVLGTFKNGEAAVVANTFGKGRALIMGYLPGIAYLYGAFPRLPYGRGGEDLSMHLYPEYRPLVREMVANCLRQVWPAMDAPVRCDNPYVEANLLREKNGAYHVALVNYAGRPIDRLSLVIHPEAVGGAHAVQSVFGAADARMDNGNLLVTMSLDRFAWLRLN